MRGLPDDALRLVLQIGEFGLSIGVPVAIDAKQAQVEHAPMSTQRLLDELPFERFARPVEARYPYRP